MPSIVSHIARFARSPKGQEMARKAQDYAKSPEGKRRIEDAKRRLAKRR